MRKFLSVLAGAALGVAAIPAGMAQDEAEPVKVMIIGTYHFGNPGQDLKNMEADDVLTERRQRELAALSEAVMDFAPTVVAVEREAEPPYVDERYPQEAAGLLETSRNEVVQIGYRIALGAGLETVHAIDEQPSDGEPDYFPYGAVAAFAEDHGEAERLQGMIDRYDPLMAAFQAAQETQSIPELLQQYNDGTWPDDMYWDVITFGEGERQPGAELAAGWFLRNAKIFNKMAQVTGPGDRVVIVYGAGHGDWLRELVRQTNGYELEPVLPYLEAAAAALED